LQQVGPDTAAKLLDYQVIAEGLLGAKREDFAIACRRHPDLVTFTGHYKEMEERLRCWDAAEGISDYTQKLQSSARADRHMLHLPPKLAGCDARDEGASVRVFIGVDGRLGSTGMPSTKAQGAEEPKEIVILELGILGAHRILRMDLERQGISKDFLRWVLKLYGVANKVIPSSGNVADLLTKPFELLRGAAGSMC